MGLEICKPKITLCDIPTNPHSIEFKAQPSKQFEYQDCAALVDDDLVVAYCHLRVALEPILLVRVHPQWINARTFDDKASVLHAVVNRIGPTGVELRFEDVLLTEAEWEQVKSAFNLTHFGFGYAGGSSNYAGKQLGEASFTVAGMIPMFLRLQV